VSFILSLLIFLFDRCVQRCLIKGREVHVAGKLPCWWTGQINLPVRHLRIRTWIDVYYSLIYILFGEKVQCYAKSFVQLCLYHVKRCTYTGDMGKWINWSEI